MKYLKRFIESEEYYRNHLSNAKEAFKGDMEYQKMLRDTARDYLTYLIDSGFGVTVQDTQLDGVYFDIDISVKDYDKSFKLSDIIDETLPFILYLESGGLERVKLTGVFIYFHDSSDREFIDNYSTLPDLELGDISCFSIAVEKV
jgi:hypothetical protein